ncbi:DUF1385 domain-containing protein [Caldalkalibacillus mannanilyticus]|uniref:DUF1385 domain-containing protein n=1 Tax=Caldalkalibacillus mannanilyticus TaxID=1418 RepID=UPI000469D2E2|nr:DUF1385 domain-containing protein [Caldalkalibacillus mannanilyticus]
MGQKPKPAYGGQAVVEGVMFTGKKVYVTAIRRKDNSIEYLELEKKEKEWVNKLRKIPFLRGNVALVEASAYGSTHLNFSTERYDIHPEEDEKILPTQQPSKLTLWLGVAVVGVLSFLFSKIIFTVVPAIVAHTLFKSWFPTHLGQNIVEGVIKTFLLFGYLYVISLTPLVKRLFQYHGAEHKVINCYEEDKKLTVQNVQDASRFHYRCGSSFIIFTILIGGFVYLMLPSEPLMERIFYRILFLPVVIGISFEVLQLTNKFRDVPILRFLGYPGLWLQKLTTKEPTNEQIEVSIASFRRMLEHDQNTLQKENGQHQAI